MTRARPIIRLVGWLGAAALTAAGCSLLHGSYPDDRCTSDADCFQAQGEACDRDEGVCRQVADAAPVPDAAPRPDAAAPADAAVELDGGPADGGLADAAPVDAAAVWTGGLP